ncbi:MAG: hypothetical protein EOO70_04845, partial [Myxococcaceae bacterium]
MLRNGCSPWAGLSDRHGRNTLPESLLGEGADLERDILGRELDGQRYAWRIELCADPGCECENLFLVVWLPGEPKRAVFAITADGRWMVEQAGSAA